MAAFLAALPSVIALLMELMKWVKSAQERDPAKEIAEITDAIRLARKASNAEEKRAAARSLSRIINRM